MGFKRSMVASMLLHLAASVFLSQGSSWSSKALPPKPVAIEAHLLIKSKDRDEKLLPQKKTQAKKVPVAKPRPLERVRAKDDVGKVRAAQHKDQREDFTGQLASLSQAFAEELAAESVDEASDRAQEHSYFDQMYSLIKASFVVPPHIDGPEGLRLRAVVRIFLAKDGALHKLKLEKSSGDAHFDKAVIDGTRRVSNFGAVPPLLQSALAQRGLVVELCPLKCQ